jgi:hypothetical protein
MRLLQPRLWIKVYNCGKGHFICYLIWPEKDTGHPVPPFSTIIFFRFHYLYFYEIHWGGWSSSSEEPPLVVQVVHYIPNRVPFRAVKNTGTEISWDLPSIPSFWVIVSSHCFFLSGGFTRSATPKGIYTWEEGQHIICRYPFQTYCKRQGIGL